jgi:capsular polysaccharide biosynthesis protein
MKALVEYAGVLRSRWRWVVWGMLLALIAALLVLILRPPVYRSSATVFVRTPGDVSTVVDGGDSYAQSRAKTYAALANSTSLSSRVVADLGFDLSPEAMSRQIHAAHRPGTAIVELNVDAPNATASQRTARVLLAEYAAMVRELEAVPGSLVPRAELVVVDPPRPAVRVAAWDAPTWTVLLGAALLGMVLAALGAVIRTIFAQPTDSECDGDPIPGKPCTERHHLATTPLAQAPNCGP